MNDLVKIPESDSRDGGETTIVASGSSELESPRAAEVLDWQFRTLCRKFALGWANGFLLLAFADAVWDLVADTTAAPSYLSFGATGVTLLVVAITGRKPSSK